MNANNTVTAVFELLDSDGDGVTDADDTCADTAENTIVDENGCEVVTTSFIYLDENGITIIASDSAVVGSSYELNGVSYLVVNSTMLKQMADDGEDVTKVVTTNVTNMNSLFLKKSSFNQDIGSWDVSNVTNMQNMFFLALVFNQDLSSWNVDEVINCSRYKEFADAWTEPKPNFTNCTE